MGFYPKKTLYNWQVVLDNGREPKRSCMVVAPEAETARLKAAQALSVSFCQNARFMTVQRYGKEKEQ